MFKTSFETYLLVFEAYLTRGKNKIQAYPYKSHPSLSGSKEE